MLAAGYAVSPHLTNRISSDAVVNAEVMRVISPIEGMANVRVPAPGTRIAGGSQTVLVENPQVDQRELSRLAQEIAAGEARLATQIEARDAMIEMRERLRERAERFSAASVDRLRAEIAEAEAELAGREALRERAAAELARGESLGGTAVIPPAEVQLRRIRLREAIAAEDAARARVRRLTVELRAAEEGLSLRDSYNDSPYSRQQAERLSIELHALEERIAETRARLAALRLAQETETVLVESRRRFLLAPLSDLVVWTRHVVPGQTVRPGELIVDLVSCENLFVEVTIPESAYVAIEPGTKVDLRFRDGLVMEGRVAVVRGVDARAREGRFAARLPGEPGMRASAIVPLSPDAARLLASGGNAEHAFCGIGRVVEARFPVSSPFFEAARNWFSTILTFVLENGGSASAASTN